MRIFSHKRIMLFATALTFIFDSSFSQTDSVAHTLEKNHFSIFPAYTLNYKGKEGVKLGLEYERKLSKHFGLGATFDFTGADYKNYAVSAGVTYKPFDFGLSMALGLGAKSYFDKELGRAWKPFVRTILVYDFHLNHFSIGPMVMYDIIDNRKNMTSYGFAFGWSI